MFIRISMYNFTFSPASSIIITNARAAPISDRNGVPKLMKYFEKHPMLLLAVGILGLSMSAVLVRYSDAPSAVTAAFRMFWTVLLMSPMFLFSSRYRKELSGVSRNTFLLCIAGGICLALHFIIWFDSLKYTSVASATAIVCTEVVWVSLGYCLVLKGKLQPKAVLAIAVTLAGSVLIAWSDSGSGGGHLHGDILALFAAVAVAVYTLIGRAARAAISTTVYTYLVYVAAAAALAAIALLQGYSLAGYGRNAVVTGFLLALFSTILGHSICSWCLKYISPAFVSASKLCEPVIAAVLAFFLFQEVPKIAQIAGGAVIIGGVLFYSRIEHNQP